MRCAQACTSPVWSPDGSQIAYVRDEPAGRRIAVVRSDGSGEEGFASSRPTNEAWTSLDWLSPFEIVYTPENNGPLRVLDLARGTDRPFLASPAKGWMFQAKVSSDGRVAFYWNRGHPQTRGIYVADRSGTLTGTFVAGHRRPVGWVDRGRRVLVTVDDYLGEDVWIVAIDLADPTTGTTSTLWKTATRMVAEATTFPGTDDILLLSRGARSDAWLIEDPLGPPAP